MWPASYAEHIRRAEERLSSFERKTVDSAWGTIEYAERGSGIPLLVSHGIGGGFDACVVTAEVWAGEGLHVIGPSRFGYFGSSLPTGANPALQADAFAGLLDALEIGRAAVLGFSAGGPPAIQFALRHPERTLSLVLASAHLPTSPYVKLPAALYRTVFSERLFWLLKTLAPGRLARIMGVPKGFRATAEEWKSIRYLMDGLFPIRPRREGMVLDGILTNPDVERYPLEEIAVPTMIIHSADDTLAHYETAPRAAARIPGVRFVTIDRGGHLFVGREEIVRKEVGEFIRSNVPAEPAYGGAFLGGLSAARAAR
jgi:pimeloyl-ACP methyl ester carboxylesterase